MLVTALVFGLLVGSFTNVLIWRIPRKESISFPPSHCPHCDHALAAKDLVPLFSWLSLSGKCRYCKAPIKTRYPIVELITGLVYLAVAWFYPPAAYGWGTLGLMFFSTILIAGSAIDLDTFTIPDELTLTGVAMGLLFSLAGVGLSVGGLPTIFEALGGAMVGAGTLMLIDLFGSWVLRRFRERQYPDAPIGHQQIALGALVGFWAGPLWGAVAALASAAINFFRKKALPIPEFLTLGGLFVSLIASTSMGGNIAVHAQHMTEGAGASALLAGLYWWWHYSRPNLPPEEDDAPYDPSAMGFGDVKLAGTIGAFLGGTAALVSIGLAVLLGAVLGVVLMIGGAKNKIKFGPYLALGAFGAMFFGQEILGL